MKFYRDTDSAFRDAYFAGPVELPNGTRTGFYWAKKVDWNKRGHEAVPFVCALCIGLLIWVIFGGEDD